MPHLAPALGWHGIYDDAPLSVHVEALRDTFRVGDTFSLKITATNTSDRAVLVRRNWKEQVVFYHIHPTTGEQVEWPGRVNTATWLKPDDVVRLRPGQSYGVTRALHVLTDDDVCTFDFRVKLVGVKDFAHKLRTWYGEAWSNAIKVTVIK